MFLSINNLKANELFGIRLGDNNVLKEIFPMCEPQSDTDGIVTNSDKGFFPSSIYLITK